MASIGVAKGAVARIDLHDDRGGEDRVLAQEEKHVVIQVLKHFSGTNARLFREDSLDFAGESSDRHGRRKSMSRDVQEEYPERAIGASGGMDEVAAEVPHGLEDEVERDRFVFDLIGKERLMHDLRLRHLPAKAQETLLEGFRSESSAPSSHSDVSDQHAGEEDQRGEDHLDHGANGVIA